MSHQTPSDTGRQSATERVLGEQISCIDGNIYKNDSCRLSGHLYLDSGNIGGVVQLSEYEYDIKIRPDTNNNRHRLWFFFSASNITNNQQVRLDKDAFF